MVVPAEVVNVEAGGGHCGRKCWRWGWLPRPSTLVIVVPAEVTNVGAGGDEKVWSRVRACAVREGG